MIDSDYQKLNYLISDFENFVSRLDTYGLSKEANQMVLSIFDEWAASKEKENKNLTPLIKGVADYCRNKLK